jgi:hypothetical protein
MLCSLVQLRRCAASLLLLFLLSTLVRLLRRLRW